MGSQQRSTGRQRRRPMGMRQRRLTGQCRRRACAWQQQPHWELRRCEALGRGPCGGHPHLPPTCIKVNFCSGSKHDYMREGHTTELSISHQLQNTDTAVANTPIILLIFICKLKDACVVAQTAAGG